MAKPRRRVKVRSWPATSGSPVPNDPMPEHAKLSPHADAHWEIRQFLRYLRDRDIELTMHTGKVAKALSTEQVELLLLRYRGVDPTAYAAESAKLLAKYGMYVSSRPASAGQSTFIQASLMDEFTDDSVVRVIEILDSLGVPTSAGRPTCAQALADVGVPRPETALLARAVKLRRTMHGTDTIPRGQFTPDDERRPSREGQARVARAKKVQVTDEDAVMSLMAKLGGGADAAQD